MAITKGRKRSVCYITVTTLISALLQDFGTYQTLVLGALVNMKKASSMLACRQGRCRRHLRLGRAATRNSSYQSPPPAPARASRLPRAFAAFDPGHGSCGGALAEGFGESATLDLIIPPAMNRSRPVGSNQPSPRWTTMLHQVTTKLLSQRRWPDAAVQRAAAHE